VSLITCMVSLITRLVSANHASGEFNHALVSLIDVIGEFNHVSV
jgi:hypothetical protein